MARTLEDWREIIEYEVPFVGIRSYSLNIISVALMAITERYGHEQANQAIEDFGLEELGLTR